MRDVIKNAIKSGPIPEMRQWRKVSRKNLTRAERVMKFIETFVFVPEGPLVGQPLRLMDFQEAFIYAIYDNDVATATAILSMARKNGKTALLAALILAHLVGPEAVRNSQLVSGAQSRAQASLVRNLAVKSYMQSKTLRKYVASKEYLKKLVGLPLNTEYVSLSSEASSNLGISPIFALLDELGQVKGEVNAFVEAITSSQGAHSDPLLIAISTQAPSDADLLSTWIDDAIVAGDPSIVCHVYEAEEKADLLDRKAWEASNPALGIFRNEKDLSKQLQKASRLPSLESSARNLLLNQRVSLERLFVPASVWKKNGEEPDLDLFRDSSRKIAIGLDLSARNDLTAAVLSVMDDNEKVHVWPFVFCPAEGVEERAKRDRAPYDAWVAQGLLIPIGGMSMDYKQVATYLKSEIGDIDVDIVAFDRWRIDLFNEACKEVGIFTESEWKKVGQGFKDQSPSLENLMSLMLAGSVRHGLHPLLNMAASNAIAVNDPTGATKLDKSKSTQRIDPLIAMHQSVFAITEGSVGEGSVDVNAMIG